MSDDFEVEIEADVPAPLPDLPQNRPGPRLGDYLNAAVEAAQREVDGGVKNEVFLGRDRIDRARDYADWRWHAYMAGEVDKL